MNQLLQYNNTIQYITIMAFEHGCIKPHRPAVILVNARDVKACDSLKNPLSLKTPNGLKLKNKTETETDIIFM
jgi:hypothetical protein